MKKQERSERLIADFEDGYAKGWFMAIGEHYRNELDIILSERSKKKETYLIWTQGPYFSFAPGNIFYDNKSAYETVWSEAVKNINIACQITSATPCKLDEKGLFSDGIVEFRIFRKNSANNGLTFSETRECSQTNFVNFLKTGNC